MPESGKKVLLAENNVTYNFLKNGKVKNIYANSGNNELLFDFTNNISVFDKIIPSQIPEKGAAICLGTTYWLNEIIDANICNTEYIGLVSPTRMRVNKYDVVKNPTTETDTYFIPAEFICRHYAAGSLIDRMKDGKVKPKDVGLDHVPKTGERLPQPFFEATTKFEEFDRPIAGKEMYELTGLTKREFEDIEDTTLKIDKVIARKVGPRGLVHIDGKKEYAYDRGRELTIVDTFASGDEDRFVDKQPFENDGTMIQKSKEFVRQHYKDIGYHDALKEARLYGKPEPDIPALPENKIRQTSLIYQALHKQLTGISFAEDLKRKSLMFA